MIGPKRLLSSGSPVARSLLQAGRRDKPPQFLSQTVMGALGVARPTVGVRLTGTLKRLVLSKVGVGFVAMAAASGGGFVIGRSVMAHRVGVTVESPTHDDAVPTRPVPANAETTSQLEPPATTSTAAGDRTEQERTWPERSVDAVRAPPEAAAVKERHVEPHPARPAGATAHAGPVSGAPSILGELDEIRQARSLVLSGDGKAAVVALDAYDASHPAGTFQEEALALRVRALRLSGNQVEADRTLRTLEALFPKSVHLAGLEP
jgi:hypothetical protein